MVPLTDSRTVLLLRQYRPALEEWVLEIPAGACDVEGEPPEHTAQRELEEELGVRARHLEQVATLYNTPGFCDELTLVYIATGLTHGPHRREGAEEEHMEVVEVLLDDIPGLVASGELRDAESVVGLLLALRQR